MQSMNTADADVNLHVQYNGWTNTHSAWFIE
jgi:hypothetical protein